MGAASEHVFASHDRAEVVHSAHREGAAEALLIILILLALIFGVGAVVKGILWVLLVAAVLVVAAAFVGYRKLKGLT